jgi:hypothetical protein
MRWYSQSCRSRLREPCEPVLAGRSAAATVTASRYHRFIPLQLKIFQDDWPGRSAVFHEDDMEDGSSWISAQCMALVIV